MQLLVLNHERDRYAGEIVAAALRRSFTASQVAAATYDALAGSALPAATVLVNPGPELAPRLATLLTAGGKGLLLGRISPAIGEQLGLDIRQEPPLDSALADPTIDSHRHHDESPAAIEYGTHPLAQAAALRRRALCRFDFANEWNNLGFGRITADGGPWSLATTALAAAATPLARLAEHGAVTSKLYAAVYDAPSGAALWFNRAVGPIDSGEWHVVETFFGDYRADALVSLPYLSEIPAGYAAAATMRLDCDEAIQAARPLWELYADAGVPLSLAVPTARRFGSADMALLRDVLRSGGAVVSHSVHHRANWGGNYTVAAEEATRSKADLEQHVGDAGPVAYAVSPFHQNPLYAVHALADAGYRGFVGGIIANDPEFLLGRAGQVPFVESPLVSHSAQCMLHGDCFERYGRDVGPYQESFDNHCRARSIFGYLDHPFSDRYQYGWSDETTRIAAHRRLLDHIGRTSDVWRPSLAGALDFLSRRNQVRLHVEGDGRLAWDGLPDDGTPRTERATPTQRGARLAMNICWKGRNVAA